MDIKEEKNCRLCLKVVENDFQIIDENSRKIFEVLLLKVNLDISKDPIICKDCAEVAEKCFNFKSACINAKELVFSNAIDKKRATSEVKDVYKDGTDIETVGENSICGFCSNYLSGSNFVSDTLMNDVTFAEMFQRLMPEMDFDIKKSIICTTCKENLEYYAKFVENCLDVEEKITKYLQNEGTPSSGHIRLSEIQHISFKNILELDHTLTRVIKQEVLKEDVDEEHFEGYDGELFKTEKIDIKVEEVYVNESACETPSNISLYESNIPCGSKIQTPSTTNISEAHIFKCATCTFATKRKSSLKSHMLTHKDITEVEMYKCLMCNFETKHRYSIKNHLLKHKYVTEEDMYKCSMCTYVTKRKSSLKSHMLTHKDITEVEMYKCSKCTFQAKRKNSLNTHMLTHKDITELQMYKCPMCTYETKQKCNLKNHIIIHKDITEVEMYKCSMCTYETRRKFSLKQHMLTHKDVTELQMYKCSMCTYETKQKYNLKKHIIIHKDIKEVEMYKCSMCTYETKHKSGLKKHVLTHNDITEVETHKCSMCTYETRCKNDLKGHMLIHKDITEVEKLKSKIGSKIFEIMRR